MDPILLEPLLDRLPSYGHVNSNMSDTPSKQDTPAAAANSTESDAELTPDAETAQLTPVKLKPSKPSVVAKNPSAKKPKPVPTAAKSGITFDDDSANVVSKPMLLLDGLAAVVAITFAVLIFLDAKPFL